MPRVLADWSQKITIATNKFPNTPQYKYVVPSQQRALLKTLSVFGDSGLTTHGLIQLKIKGQSLTEQGAAPTASGAPIMGFINLEFPDQGDYAILLEAGDTIELFVCNDDNTTTINAQIIVSGSLVNAATGT